MHSAGFSPDRLVNLSCTSPGQHKDVGKSEAPLATAGGGLPGAWLCSDVTDGLSLTANDGAHEVTGHQDPGNTQIMQSGQYARQVLRHVLSFWI